MPLPLIVTTLYGEFSFTGLYSFEFVDKNRNTVTEIFFMIPPKTKNVSEPTRSSTVATLGGNYSVDGGNGTKNITIGGELYFPYIGSPANPVARDSALLPDTISGYEEFLKLRWMLIRYRDYTMTKDAKIDIPTAILGIDSIAKLYKKVSKNIKEKTGSLYDEIKVIFHDYDMEDHYYCRVVSLNSAQGSDKHIAINYDITLDCYEPDTGQKTAMTITKKSTTEVIDYVTASMLAVDY